MNLQHSDILIARLERRGLRLYYLALIVCFTGILIAAAFLIVSLTSLHKKTEAYDFGSIINSNAKLKFMNHKSTPFAAPAQHLIAGLNTNSTDIEFYGWEGRTVKFFRAGKNYNFEDLPPQLYKDLLNAYNNDPAAKKALSIITDSTGRKIIPSLERKVELYTYYMYGGLDGKPDIKDGKLQPSENFRETKDCISLNWESKWVRLNGVKLTPREIVMVDLFTQDEKDEVVALELGITPSTLSFHKKNLFEKVGVQSKNALTTMAVQQQAAFFPQNQAV